MHACVLMAMFLFIRLNVCGHFWAHVCFTCTGLACLLSWENRLCSIWTEMCDVATVEIAYHLTLLPFAEHLHRIVKTHDAFLMLCVTFCFRFEWFDMLISVLHHGLSSICAKTVTYSVKCLAWCLN